MKKFSYLIKDRLTPRNDFVFEFCGEVKGKKILDIGCGFGWYEKMAMENGAKKTVGIEPKKENFHHALSEVPSADFKIGSALSLPLNDSEFDKVVLLEVLEHLPKGKEEVCLKEIYRVLNRGGELILSTPNKHHFSCLFDPAWCFGHRHYCLVKIKNLLEKNGFLIKKVFIYGGFWELFRMIPHYFFKHFFNAEDPFKKFLENKIIKDKDNPHNFAYLYVKAVKK